MHSSSSRVGDLKILTLLFIPTCFAIAIDNPECIKKVLALQNQSVNPNFVPDLLHVELSDCIRACGQEWNFYSLWDIQKRIAAWVVPLFILISLAEFAPLRSRNTAAVSLHLLADPISSTAHILWKLQNTLEYHRQVQGSLPIDHQRPATIILSAYEEWENVWYTKHTNLGTATAGTKKGRITEYSELEDIRYAKHDNLGMPTDRTRKARVTEYVEWLNGDRERRGEACLRAANELALCRSRGLWKTFIGILNYVVAISLAFVKVATGDFNNRTGHSISFAMLYSWLIPAIILTSLVGSYHTRSSTRRILVRMLKDARPERNMSVASTASGDVAEPLPKCFQFSARTNASAFYEESQEAFTELPKFPDHLTIGSVDYRLLEWCGGNATFSPRQLSNGTRRKTLFIFAAIPCIISILSAVFISYFNPTRGVGCRTVLQFSFFASWILSAFLTWLIGHFTSSSYFHWRWTLLKDALFITPQLISYSSAFVGWFNSCFCWSAAFSLHEKAYVVLRPAIEIMNACKFEWPILTGLVLLLQFAFVGTFWAYYASIVHLHRACDNDENNEFEY